MPLEETQFDLVLNTDSCVADVGAHIGSFLEAVLRLAPQGTHYAFEASPRKAEWLRSPEAKVFLVAISNAAGTATFYEDVQNPGFSSLVSDPSSGKSVNQYEVGLALDDLKLDLRRRRRAALMFQARATFAGDANAKINAPLKRQLKIATFLASCLSARRPLDLVKQQFTLHISRLKSLLIACHNEKRYKGGNFSTKISLIPRISTLTDS